MLSGGALESGVSRRKGGTFMKHTIGQLALTSDAARLDLRRKLHALAVAAGTSPVAAAHAAAVVSQAARAAGTLPMAPNRGEDARGAHVAEVSIHDEGYAWFLRVDIGGAAALQLELPGLDGPLGGGLGGHGEAPGSPSGLSWLALHRAAFAEPSREMLMAEMVEKNRELERHQIQLEQTVAKRTEQLHEAMEKAETANRTKSAFLAAMSHEIRTPMNAVLNMVATVLESPLDPQQQEYLRVADGSARHLLSLINDILDFSKIEAGKVDLENIPFSLHMLLEGVSDLFRAKAAESRVELVSHIDPGARDGVRGDPTRLRQILTNLVGNAFKFTAKGEILLRLENLESGVRLSVKDSGIGISPEQQARLFQPFVQADSATTRRYGGTGLGLTISRRLALLMGGDITIASAAGQGTTFFVDVPLSADAAGNRTELHLPPGLGSQVLLLVEDNATCRRALETMFISHGLPCVSFPAMEPALGWLKTAEAGRVGAAMVDWRLGEGGMDGVAGIQALRRAQVGLPCFLASAFAGREAQEGMRAAGASAFIPKPITWTAAQAALTAALAPMNQAAGPAVDPAGDRFDGILALLAEDNPQNQLVAKILLKKLGITVEVAGNGKLALEMAQANPGKYQIILMDMQMPEMDGLESTRRIRAAGEEIPVLKTIPIVAMTANAMKSDLDACLEAGMNGFVVKPIDKAALLAELGRVLKGGGV